MGSIVCQFLRKNFKFLEQLGHLRERGIIYLEKSGLTELKFCMLMKQISKKKHNKILINTVVISPKIPMKHNKYNINRHIFNK